MEPIGSIYPSQGGWLGETVYDYLPTARLNLDRGRLGAFKHTIVRSEINDLGRSGLRGLNTLYRLYIYEMGRERLSISYWHSFGRLRTGDQSNSTSPYTVHWPHKHHLLFSKRAANDLYLGI